MERKKLRWAALHQAAILLACPLSGAPIPPAQSASVWLCGLAPDSSLIRFLCGLVVRWVPSAASVTKYLEQAMQ